MALTEIPSELSSTPSIVDNGNSTAITIDASENVTLAGTATMGGLTLDGNNSYTSNIKFDYGASAPTYFSNWGYKSSSDGNKVFLTMTDGGAAKDVLVANYNGNVGIGVSSPQRSLVLGKGDSTGVQTQYTNSTTGAALGDGFTVGIDGSENAEFWNFENTNMLFATNSTERMRIDASGNLLVGTTSVLGSGKVNIKYASNTKTGITIQSTIESYNTAIQFLNTAGTQVGTVNTSATSTAYNTSSDYRLKENVVAITGATERLKQLNPSRFNFIADADTTVDGFLAHEVQDVVPEAITGTKDAMRDEEYEVTPAVLDDDGNVTTEAVMGTRSVPDYQGIDQSKLVPLLVATIQELEARLTALENN